MGNVIELGRAQLSKGLNRDLAPGVKLTAEVKSVRVLAVRARRSAIRLRAQADANARLTVRQETSAEADARLAAKGDAEPAAVAAPTSKPRTK